MKLKIIEFHDLGQQPEGYFLSEFTLNNGKVIKSKVGKYILKMKCGIGPAINSLQSWRLNCDKLTLKKHGVSEEEFDEFVRARFA